MKDNSQDEKHKSLVEQLEKRLFFTVSLLLVALIIRFGVGIFENADQYNLGERKLAIRQDIDGLLRTMLDQETGLRGYIATNDPTFLEPFNSGRPQYLSSLQHLKNETKDSFFSNTAAQVANVDVRANDWYTNFAQVQIKNMQSGKLATARSARTGATGKALFDRFRAAEGQLEQTSAHELAVLQDWTNSFNWWALVSTIVLSSLAILILFFTFIRFVHALRDQLLTLNIAASQFGSGDLSARVANLFYSELNELGQSFNRVIAALQEQQDALKERDVLESVLQLNTILTTSLDFDMLAQEFQNRTLSLLDLQVIALYLYNPQNERLLLTAAQGFDYSEMQKEFQLGEGTIGRTALSRQPTQLIRPTSDEVYGFQIKTIFGLVLPAGFYQLPLVRGDELLGVLSVGSMYSMSEKARNVLNVVASSLAVAISNARAYQRISSQSEELERRGHTLEDVNAELRQQRDVLAKLNSDLAEANRARSQFLSTMSHELRTPLTAIIGFSQILLKDSEKVNFNTRQIGDLERILKNGKHLLTLINDVLDLAKVEAGRMDVKDSQVNLRELVSSVIEEVQSIASEQKLILRSTVEEGADHLETDPMKLRQILLNLVSNALKFTEHGEVTVTATRMQPAKNEAECIAIAVQDSGIGITKEQQERIFEAFYQADSGSARKFGGTGLGLSIVHQLTTLLGGRIEVKSSPGQGSTFIVILPVKASRKEVEQNNQDVQATQQRLLQQLQPSSAKQTTEVRDVVAGLAPAIAPPMAGASPATTSPTKEAAHAEQSLILAVDDNPDVLSLITSILEKASYRVVGVQDPLQALEMVQELHPRAIILDVMLPNLNGWQILQMLKSNPTTASIPVIMLTIVSDRTTAFILGADDYLKKPFEHDALLKILQRVTGLQIPVGAYTP